MNTMLKLLLEQPRAVIDAGVVIPCALQDLLVMALEDRTCTFGNVAESDRGPAIVGARPVQLVGAHRTG